MRSFIVISVTFLLALSGCANIVKQAPPNTSLPPSGEEVFVFGKIRWIQNGEERESYSDITLSVLRAENTEKGSITVEKDGRFFAILPKGVYVINEINWWDWWSGSHWIVPKVAFKMAQDQHLYYLGTLVVDLKTKRDIIGGLWIKGFTIHIEDEEEGAIEAFHERYPDQNMAVLKALMIHDPRIPRAKELEIMRALLDTILRTLPVMPVLMNP